MADSNFWCRECQKNTDHMDIRESRKHICAGCGLETQFRAGYKMPVKEPVKIDISKIDISKIDIATPVAETIVKKTETIKEKCMPKARFTAEEIEDIKREKSEGFSIKDIANRRNCAVNTIWRMLYKTPKRVSPASDKSDTLIKRGYTKRANTASQDEAGGGFRHALERMVAEAVDSRMAGLGLDTLDAKIEAVLARLLK